MHVLNYKICTLAFGLLAKKILTIFNTKEMELNCIIYHKDGISMERSFEYDGVLLRPQK